MEKVKALMEKLQHQMEAHLPASELLFTVQLMYGELKSQTIENKPLQTGEPFVMAVNSVPSVSTFEIKQKQVDVSNEDKTVAVLEVDENEIEEELNQIKKNAENINTMASNVRPEVVEQKEEAYVPVTIKPIYSSSTTTQEGTLNDKLREEKTEISEKLVETPIKDLKKAIGVNDRYLFITELFKGDEAGYERSIKTINGFSIYPEAEYWIRKELKLKLSWPNSDTVRQFDQLVRRRFL
ncbi:MAG: hypothetical protein NVSMB45_15120 [Ginsengibacter sp.]